MSPTAHLLIASRAVRSLGQGALAVDFALYLAGLHWNAAQIGLVYMAGLIVGAALTLASGPYSDRIGRKPFLVWYAVAQVVAAIIALATSAPAWLSIAAIVGGYGRGANGAAGPFGPVEQAWLSDGLAEADFGVVYSFNAAVGFGGMAAGALLAALPALWQGVLPGPLAYRPLFLLVLIGSLITLVLLSRMTDTRPPAARSQAPHPESERIERRQQHSMLLRLMGINSLNGLAIGVIGPLMAYWFHVRFAKGPGAIGPVMALGFFMAGLGALMGGSLTRRLGAAKTVVAMRLVGVALLALLPFAPTYELAAVCYVLRASFNQGTSGARQAVSLRLVGPMRRGLAASLNAISMQVPRAIGPVIGGVLLDADLLVLPMLIAAALQAVYLGLYALAFRRIE